MQTAALKAPAAIGLEYRSTFWVKMILLLLLILGGLVEHMEIIRPANSATTMHYYSLHIFCKSFINGMN